MLLPEDNDAVDQKEHDHCEGEDEEVGEDQADLGEGVVDGVVAELEEGEEGGVGDEERDPFEDYVVLEFALEDVLEPDSSLLEPVYLRDGQKFNQSPHQQQNS